MKAGFRQTASLMAITVAVLGCSGNPHDNHQEAAHESGTEEADHQEHVHVLGPHKGHVIQLGHNEASVELVLHDDRHEAVAYLTPPAESVAPDVVPDVRLQLFEDGQIVDYVMNSVETDDGTTAFSCTDEKAHSILDAGHVQGRIRVAWGDKEFSAPLDDLCSGH